MANATKYVDNVNGSDANTGDSEAQAYATIAFAISAISGGGNIIYVQDAGSNYSVTTTHNITSTQAGDTTNGVNKIEGYTTTPGARDGRPTITSATNSIALFSLNAAGYWDFVHLELTHTAATRGAGITRVTANSTQVRLHDSIINGCSIGFGASSGSLGLMYLEGVEITACTSHAIENEASTTHINACDIHDNTGSGWYNTTGTSNVIAQDSIFDTNNYGIFNDAANRGIIVEVVNCVIVDNTADGIRDDSIAASAGALTLDLQNNVIYGNGGYGINSADTSLLVGLRARSLRNNAFGSNTSGARNNVPAGIGEVTLTADPFVSRAGRDFSPNTDAGGGALLRAGGFPATYPAGTTDSFPDIGVQHQDSGGSTTARRGNKLGVFRI